MSISSDFWSELKKLTEEQEKQKKATYSAKSSTKTTTKTSASKPTTTKTTGSKKTVTSANKISSDFWNELRGNDIAPVSSRVTNRMTVGDIAPTSSKKKDKEDKWYNSGLFEDGWDFGDVTKTILGIDEDSASLKELTWNSAKKGYYNARYGEESFKAMDGLANEKDVYAKILAGDEYQFTPGNKFAEGVSGAFELIGQQARQFSNPTTLGMAGTAAVGAFALGQAGPQALAPEEVITVPGAAIAGFSAGSAAANFQIEAGHAYNEMLEAGISEKTAKRVATAVGGVNAGLELLQVDELLDAYKVTKATGTTKNFTKKILDELVDRGVDVAKETAQEVAQEGVTIAGVQAASKIDNDEWAYTADDVKSRLADTAKSSALSFGMLNVPATVKNSVSIAKDHNQTKWIRETEQKVTDRVYENLVAEAEKDGRKLTKQEKAEIRDSVTRDLEKGGISTDLIESVLDEEGYNAFQAEKDNFFTNTKKAYNEAQTREAAQLSQLQKQLEELVDAPNTVGNSKKYDSIVSQITELTENPESNALRAQLDAEAKRINQIKDQLRTKVHDMVKGTKLEASYDELIRRNQKFAADATQYQGEYARKTIQNFVDSGLADNTTEFHEQADWLAKLAEGRQLTFKLTSDEQLKGTVYDVKGKRVNAFIDESTGEITLNIDSNDGVKTAAGHDVSHTVEGTEHYAAYQDHLFKFAIEQEGLDSFNARLKHYEELYKGREDTTPEKELTAQLMGEYGFTDQAFVDRLLTTDKNLFQKIFDEIKYMYRLATAGSKAQRELEKAMHMYEKAWHEGGTKNTADSGVKNSIETLPDGNKYVRADRQVIFGNDPDSWSEQVESYINNKIRNGEDISLVAEDGDVLVLTATTAGKMADNHTSHGTTMEDEDFYLKANAAVHIDELAQVSTAVPGVQRADVGARHGDFAKDGWTYRTAYFQDFDKKYYRLRISVAKGADGKVVYNIGDVKERSFPTINGSSAKNGALGEKASSSKKVPQTEESVNTKYSLSDTNGTEVSPAVAKRFGNSKAVDENGKLKVLYHGTAAGEFSIFDKAKGSVEGDFGSGFYFTDDADDVENNYEGGGPDFENKVGRRADEIWGEEDIEYEEAEQRAREELYKGSHLFKVYLNIENPAVVGETILFDPDSYYSQYDQEDYDSEDDYLADVEQLIADEIDGIIWEVEQKVDVENTDGIAEVLWGAFNEGGVDPELLKKRLNSLYLEDSNGNLVANEVARQIIESLGYDGIIDPTVSTKWNMHMNAGTTHYIVFKPNQIKAVTNQNPTDNPDIHRSLSNGKETELKNGDVPLSKFKYNPKQEFAPSIPAPIRSDVLPGKRQSVSEMFPDEPDVSQAEYDNLVAVKEATEARLAELAASADFDNPDVVSEFERINAEWVEASNRLLEMDNERSERIDSLSDADAPPETDAPYYESEPTTLTKKATADIVRDVRASLSLSNQQMADCKDIIEQYRTGKIQTREQLVDALRDKFGSFKETEVNERLAEVKREIRTRRLKVSDTIKHGIADYASVMRSNRGKILFAKDGLEVDELYKELQEQFPDYFNENEKLSPEDQFRQIVDIVNTPHIEETERTKDIGNIEEAADLIINGIGEFKRNQDLALSNRESKQAFESLMRQADRYAPVDDIAPVAKPATTPKTTVSKKESVAPVKQTQQSGRVAKVLTEETSTEKKSNKAWSWVKEHVLDKGMVFEDLSKATGNRRLEAKWNFIRNSGARAQRLIGKGTENVRSLNSIRKVVEKSGKTEQFYDYLYHRHNVGRMTLADRFEGTPNKPVFGDSVTAKMSSDKIRQYEQKNPEFKEWAKDVYGYMSHLRGLLVKNGVISQETAMLWQKMYPCYVPIRRAGDNGLNINVPLDTNKTGVNAPIKRATGGSRDILPLFDTMAMRTEQTYKAIAKNSFGVELKSMLGSTVANEALTVDGVIDSLDSEEGLLKKGENGMNPTFTVFENGERVEFEITEEMYEAMKPASGITASTSKVLNGISNFRRGTLTEYNPWFLLKNAIKDQQDIIINSQHPVKTYANMPVAIAEMVGNGEYYQEYLENGGEQNTYFDSESNTFNENKALEAIKWATGLNEIAWANNKIEMLPRLAEYIASRKAGRSVEVAMLDAARVTTNFAAGGDVTKFANRNGATFLNASVQGAVQQARNIREAKMNGLKGWAGLAARYLVAGLPAVLLNNLLWEDDEEYEELADYVKRDYYVVAKFDDGKFLRIPKGRTVAVIQNAFEQMDNLRTGDDDLDLKAFLDLAVSNLAPNNPLENNVLSPLIQVKNNKTWYGEDLVPSRLQDVPAAEQYDESTDDISRWLGEKTNTSPVKWNYLLDQYSGVLGDTFLPMLTPEAESGDDTTLGTMTAPLRDMFTTDSVINNQTTGNFYDLKDQIDIAANSSKATDEDKMKSTYLQAVGWELSDLYKQKREIQNGSLADSAKYKQSRDIQKQINEIMENALGGYENVSINGLYSEVGDKRFNHDAESGKWYEIKAKNPDGSDNWYYQKEQEVTKGLGISYGEYWNNREEYNYAYDNPEKYTVAKAVGGYKNFTSYNSELWNIKADKDKNGKSINGSRKKKVVEYVNNLDADYGEKIILFKSEYPADDTYNVDIIEYLNSRDDISYQEMETILKYLGFKVDSKGNIRW